MIIQTLKEKILKLAISSRIFIILLQCVSNAVIPDHDANVFVTPSDPKDPPGICDSLVNFLLGGLVRWDAQYFLHIAKYGYTYENCLAFFPMFPMMAQLVSTMFSPFTLFVTEKSLLLMSFTLINICAFSKAATILFDLSLVVLRNEELAYRSAVFFCLNPASIFFTAPYSEALFALSTFSGFLSSHLYQTKTSAIAFGFSCATRSNGILNIGFTIHKQLRILFQNLSSKSLVLILLIPLQVMGSIIPLAISVFVSLLPFIMFQVFSFGKFCIDDRQNMPQVIIDHAKENHFKLAGYERTIWCNSSIPFAYSYVQSHYWDVGFLKYFQWKQVPNFFLALPIFCIILTSSIKFMSRYRHHSLFLGFPYTKVHPHLSKNTPPPEAFLYIAHAIFLLIFCVLCIHVQVTTRMLASSSPVLYWFAAYISLSAEENTEQESIQKPSTAKTLTQVESRENMESFWRVFVFSEEPKCIAAKFMKYYFILYLLVGTILFSNHFPWT